MYGHTHLPLLQLPPKVCKHMVVLPERPDYIAGVAGISIHVLRSPFVIFAGNKSTEATTSSNVSYECKNQTPQ